MALRALILCLCSLLLALLLVPQVSACFGPKLFVGVSSTPEDEVLYALVTLYVKEKTGVESLLVEVEEGVSSISLIAEDKADLVFVKTGESLKNSVFEIEGFPVLVSGKRPLEELQFTTVLPAVKKLNRLLKQDDVKTLVDMVSAGESAMAAARKFFMKNRMI